jgi:hypothetical protein
MYFGLPLVNCLFHHVEYKLYPFIFIFLFLWVGFGFAFCMQNWFEKQMKNNEERQKEE